MTLNKKFLLTKINVSLRSELGAILFYFYICDRTSILGDSKKVSFAAFLF